MCTKSEVSNIPNPNPSSYANVTRGAVPKQPINSNHSFLKNPVSIKNRFRFLSADDPESEDSTASQVYSDASMTRTRIRRGKKNPLSPNSQSNQVRSRGHKDQRQIRPIPTVDETEKDPSDENFKSLGTPNAESVVPPQMIETENCRPHS